MKRIVLVILASFLFSAPASADFFKFYYGEHEIVGTPSDLGAVKAMLDESKVPARAAVDGNLTRLDGQFPIDPYKRRHEAIVEFVARHRAAFGLKDPVSELAIQYEEAVKTIPFQTKASPDDAYLSVFVHIIPRVNTDAKMRVYTVPGMILRVESEMSSTFEYDYTPVVPPYDALDKALFELGEEKKHYKDDINISLEMPGEGSVYGPHYNIYLQGNESAARVLVNSDTGEVLEVDKNPEKKVSDR